MAIKTVDSLNDLLTDIKHQVESVGSENIAVFFDWDDTIVCSNTATLIEPDVTKTLFEYLLANNIIFAILTGRYSTSVCYSDFGGKMDSVIRSINEYMYNALNEMSPDIKRRFIHRHNSIYGDGSVKIESDKCITGEAYSVTYQNKCVGSSLCGILYSTKKGETIYGYLQALGKNVDDMTVFFVDDNDEFLTNVKSVSQGKILNYKRLLPKTNPCRRR